MEKQAKIFLDEAAKLCAEQIVDLHIEYLVENEIELDAISIDDISIDQDSGVLEYMLCAASERGIKKKDFDGYDSYIFMKNVRFEVESILKNKCVG